MANAAAVDGMKAFVLPVAQPGEVVRVYNGHATNGLPIYPQVGGTINSSSANAAVTIEGKTVALFENLNGTDWVAVYTVNS